MATSDLSVAAKSRVRAALQSALEATLTASKERYALQHQASELDQDASFTNDDLSQADEAGDLAGFTGTAIARTEQLLARLAELDISRTDAVRPGAVVSFSGASYLVGVPAAEIEVDGVIYEGLALDAPAYAAIEGLRTGDTFTINGATHTLDSVS